MEIKDLKTHKVYLYEYRVEKGLGENYIVEVYSKGKLVSKYESKYNPLDPSATKKILAENSKNSGGLIGILAYSY